MILRTQQKKRYCMNDGSLGTLLIMANRWIVVLNVPYTVPSFNMQHNNRITVNSNKCFSWMNAIKLWTKIYHHVFNWWAQRNSFSLFKAVEMNCRLYWKTKNKTIDDCLLVNATIEYNGILCRCQSVFVSAFLSIHVHISAFLTPFLQFTNTTSIRAVLIYNK